MNKTCIIILGPTAVGKTAFALQLAQSLSTEIISADSRQCYRELNIGVAKPSNEELSQVNHYFINSHSVTETVNAAVFEKYALEKAKTIFDNSDYAVMVGGTGLYIKAFCEGMDEIPAIKEGVREVVTAGYKEHGLVWLQNELRIKDPAWFETGETQNPQRMMRALEVMISTGKSIRSFLIVKKKARPFNIIKIGLEIPREKLYQQVNSRVENMMKAGLLNEVEGLVQFRNMNALQTVGYCELFGYLDGNVSLEEAVQAIQLNTRHYAKRQLTWFKREKDVEWIHPDIPIDSIINRINKNR